MRPVPADLGIRSVYFAVALVFAGASACSEDGTRSSADASTTSTRIKCATPEGEARCLANCAPHQECFTQVACGGGGCWLSESGDAAPPDDSCHWRCEEDRDCPAGERCVVIPFMGCTGFDGIGGLSQGKRICCAGESGCM